MEVDRITSKPAPGKAPAELNSGFNVSVSATMGEGWEFSRIFLSAKNQSSAIKTFKWLDAILHNNAQI